MNKRTDKKAISYRDFSTVLEDMVTEKKMRKVQSTEDNNKRLPMVLYSLTEDAIKEHRLGILGIDPEKERLRRLYQLLFFYAAISPIRNISKEQLDKIKNELVIERWLHTVGTNSTEIIYKPKPMTIESFRIITNELSDIGPKRETKFFHYYKPWSFIKEEIVNLVATNTTVGQRRKKSQNSIVMPFVSNLFPFTEWEINKVFDALQDTHLIRPVQDLILNQTRFIIADESLQKLVNEIWTIHWLELEVLKSKMNYFESPNGKEIQWLKQIYGENEAVKIIAEADHTRSSTTKKDQEQIKNIQERMEYDINQIDLYVMLVNKKYSTKIQEYNFPSDLIEQVCFRKIFSKSEV
jgi:RNase H-fold protein (predicted Holliday junction resolvase)